MRADTCLTGITDEGLADVAVVGSSIQFGNSTMDQAEAFSQIFQFANNLDAVDTAFEATNGKEAIEKFSEYLAKLLAGCL